MFSTVKGGSFEDTLGKKGGSRAQDQQTTKKGKEGEEKKRRVPSKNRKTVRNQNRKIPGYPRGTKGGGAEIRPRRSIPEGGGGKQGEGQ